MKQNNSFLISVLGLAVIYSTSTSLSYAGNLSCCTTPTRDTPIEPHSFGFYLGLIHTAVTILLALTVWSTCTSVLQLFIFFVPNSNQLDFF